MKITLFLITLSTFTLVSCGKKVSEGSAAIAQRERFSGGLTSSCSVERDEVLDEVTISCPDGSSEVLKNGKSCEVEQLTAGSMISCGEDQVFVRDGVDGKDGKDGKDGQNGSDGSACSVIVSGDGKGSLISCEDGTQAFIKNGADGADGADGSDGSDGVNGKDGLDFVAEIIDPCGEETTHGFDEVLIVLSSGDILAHLATASEQHLIVLKKNRGYITSDGTGCRFSINSEGEVVY